MLRYYRIVSSTRPVMVAAVQRDKNMAKLIFNDGATVKEKEMPEKELTIGRNGTCDLSIIDASMSGIHCSIKRGEDGWVLCDHDSSNGTFLNDVRISEEIVRTGDVLRFGNVSATFVEGSDTVIVQAEAPRAAPHKTPPAVAEKAPPVSAEKPPPVERSRKSEPEDKLTGDDIELVAELNRNYGAVREQLSKVIIGQDKVVEEVLVAVFSRGHALLLGVPGLAKTLLVSTLAQVLDLKFKRVQFTPDLMPSDITGTEVLEEDKLTGQREFRFVKGPLFTNMLLADEINRTPPKTQAALLEAMQEHHITVGATTYPLEEPFFVLATQNPIEQEGTYPLPEAQLDRFLFNIVLDYPSAEEESQIILSVTGAKRAKLDKILDGETVIKLQELIRRVPVAPHVVEYARDLVRATRPQKPEAPDFVKEMVSWGAGPRAGISLIQAAKARAVLNGRHHATTFDVSCIALPVMRHRVVTTFAAESAGVKSDDVINMLLKSMKSRESLDI